MIKHINELAAGKMKMLPFVGCQKDAGSQSATSPRTYTVGEMECERVLPRYHHDYIIYPTGEGVNPARLVVIEDEKEEEEGGGEE